LTPLSIGQTIQAGQAFAKIGPQPENGNWPPHAHFQIILDLIGNQVDFPGVGFPSEKNIWASICPDPRLLTSFGAKTTPLTSAEILLKKRTHYLGKNLSLSYRQPLEMVRGQMQYLIDHTGRRYLDTVNNVPHVGHQHPAVVQAGMQQMNLLNTNTRYLHPTILEYAEELSQLFPNPLEVCRMAKTVTGQKDFVVLETGYHGNTNACIDVSSYKFDGKGGKGAPATTHKISMPDPFRGKYATDSDSGTNRYVQEIKEVILSLREKGLSPAAFIHESILSCGGQVVPPSDFFEKAYREIHRAGGLCIADEVQTGMGRVGSHHWAFELFGVVPDIVTLGKPIGNGHPLGAVITTRKIADAFANGMEFFSTFGGNPVSTAIGLEVLKTVQREGLREQAHQVGNYLKQGLRELAERYPIIADVRGEGLFLGFEMMKLQDPTIPATSSASYLVNRMRAKGVLMSTDGPDENVIKIKPPICFTQPNADLLLQLLEKTLQESALQNI
jgi:4-aminobutyrate aminotransferase-like enzyme